MNTGSGQKEDNLFSRQQEPMNGRQLINLYCLVWIIIVVAHTYVVQKVSSVNCTLLNNFVIYLALAASAIQIT